MASLARINGLKRVERMFSKVKERANTLTGESKVQQFMSALLLTMPNWVSTEFSLVEYKGEGNINVTLEKDSAYRWRLVASGSDVLFIEFGAGIVYPPAPNAGEFGFGPRTWSDTHAQQIEKDLARGGAGGWYYRKEKVYGNPGAYVMPRAAMVIEEKIQATFRQVYGR